MRNNVTSSGLKGMLLIAFVLLATSAFAASETFKGVLIPNKVVDAPIPIVVELESSYGRLTGRVKTSSPLIGEGPITSGEKHGIACKLESEIGIGKLWLAGDCMSSVFEGKYEARVHGGTGLDGTFRLKRVPPEKGKKRLSATEQRRLATATTTACLKANNTCLAVCPRGDYNAEFICANTCRHRLAACKAKIKKSMTTLVPDRE